jgi:glycosyltransferase involved in cell wall biosynthesis
MKAPVSKTSFQFRDKNILIISPNSWGNIYISKHNYALELAKLGNNVFFLEPVVAGPVKKNLISYPVQELPNLRVISKAGSRIYDLLRFKCRPLYDIMIKPVINKIIRELDIAVDLVWCFETNLYSDLKYFKGAYTIYHPVDPVIYEFQQRIASTADIVFTVSESILKTLQPYNRNSFIINHGLNNDFAIAGMQRLAALDNSPSAVAGQVRVGFIGNLLRPEINIDFISAVIDQHPDVEFNFWSPININDSNISGDDTATTRNFIRLLQESSNVKLHGLRPQKELAALLTEMDILLLPLQHTNKFDCSNSHKVMEYLSTGKVIVANYINSYRDTDLLEMTVDDNTEHLLEKFNIVISDLLLYNSIANQRKRITYALNNTYFSHINEISRMISDPIN